VAGSSRARRGRDTAPGMRPPRGPRLTCGHTNPGA
jgi:hypothetical protein